MWWLVAAAMASTVSGSFTDSAGRSAVWTADDHAELDGDAGLLLFFHEDGGDGRYQRYAKGKVARLAREHHLRAVSVQEPELGYWWAPNAGSNSAWVAEFLPHLVTTLGSDASRVYFAGKSGGASFASGLPAHLGYRYPGGVVGLCGVDIPRVNGVNDEDDPPPFEASPPPSEASEQQRLYFGITADDELRALSEATADYYRGQGLEQVAHVLIPGAGHCGFRLVDELERGLLWVDPPPVPEREPATSSPTPTD